MLIEEDDDLAAFCNRHYISRSTCFRQTKKLVEYLKEYNINLNLSNLTFVRFRNVDSYPLFNFFWFVSLGESLDIVPYSQEVRALIYKHEEAQHKNKFDFRKKQASLHCLICLLRIKTATLLISITYQGFFHSKWYRLSTSFTISSRSPICV